MWNALRMSMRGTCCPPSFILFLRSSILSRQTSHHLSVSADVSSYWIGVRVDENLNQRPHSHRLGTFCGESVPFASNPLVFVLSSAETTQVVRSSTLPMEHCFQGVTTKIAERLIFWRWENLRSPDRPPLGEF